MSYLVYIQVVQRKLCTHVSIRYISIRRCNLGQFLIKNREILHIVLDGPFYLHECVNKQQVISKQYLSREVL